MMSRIKRVLKQAVTGYIPHGNGMQPQVPLLNQIKTEPLKQEKPEELTKMPEEEHDER